MDPVAPCPVVLPPWSSRRHPSMGASAPAAPACPTGSPHHTAHTSCVNCPRPNLRPGAARSAPGGGWTGSSPAARAPRPENITQPVLHSAALHIKVKAGQRQGNMVSWSLLSADQQVELWVSCAAISPALPHPTFFASSTTYDASSTAPSVLDTCTRLTSLVRGLSSSLKCCIQAQQRQRQG